MLTYGLIISISLLLFFTLFEIEKNPELQGKFETSPESARVTIPQYKTGNVPPFSFQVKSNTSISNIGAHFSDLHSAGGEALWIPRNMLRIDPPNFDLQRDQIQDIQLIMKLPNTTGSFLGSMILTANNTKLKEIPINVSIYSKIPIIPLVIVAIGVIVGFVIKYAKMRMDTKDAALDSMEKSEKAARDAGLEDRLDPTFFKEGDNQFKRGISQLQIGDFDQAKKFFDAAVDYYRTAKKADDPSEAQQGQRLTDENRASLVDSARTYKGLFLSLQKAHNTMFLLTTILLSIVVMQVWIQLYPRLESFDEVGIEYISAFLLGYGSQSLLGEVIEFSRKR